MKVSTNPADDEVNMDANELLAHLHAEPPGYAERFERVMDEMADIEAAAKVAA